VSANYLRIWETVLRGRHFTPADNEMRRQWALVNESFVKAILQE